MKVAFFKHYPDEFGTFLLDDVPRRDNTHDDAITALVPGHHGRDCGNALIRRVRSDTPSPLSHRLKLCELLSNVDTLVRVGFFRIQSMQCKTDMLVRVARKLEFPLHVVQYRLRSSGLDRDSPRRHPASHMQVMQGIVDIGR